MELPLSSRTLADGLSRVYNPGLILLSVGMVSTSPVLLADELSRVYYPGLVLLSVGMASTSPVPFQFVVEGPVQPPGRREGRSRYSPK